MYESQWFSVCIYRELNDYNRKNIILFSTRSYPTYAKPSTDQGTVTSPSQSASQRHQGAPRSAWCAPAPRAFWICPGSSWRAFGFGRPTSHGAKASTMVLWWCIMCIFSNSPTGLGWFGYIWMLWACYFWIKTVNVLEAGDRDLEILLRQSQDLGIFGDVWVPGCRAHPPDITQGSMSWRTSFGTQTPMRAMSLRIDALLTLSRCPPIPIYATS